MSLDAKRRASLQRLADVVGCALEDKYLEVSNTWRAEKAWKAAASAEVRNRHGWSWEPIPREQRRTTVIRQGLLPLSYTFTQRAVIRPDEPVVDPSWDTPRRRKYIEEAEVEYAHQQIVGLA